MAEPRPADIAVVPLTRDLLEGVDDGSGAARRRVDLAVLPFFEDERPLQGLAGLVDWRTSGSLSALVRSGFCTGAADEAVLLPGRRTLPMERLVLLGLGPARAFDRAAAEATGERLVALVEGLAPRDVLVAMPGRAPERTVVEAVFDGLTRALARRLPRESDAQAQRAAKAVGDESTGPVLVDTRPPPPRPTLAPTPLAPTQEVQGHQSPSAGSELGSHEAPSERAMVAGVEAPAEKVARDGPPRAFEPVEPGDPVDQEGGLRRWWVAADPRHEARLRRLLEGPPRAAEPGT